jgi:tight adherence protein B
MSSLLTALLVGGGLALLVTGVLLRGRERDADLAAVLDLPFGERDVRVEAITERPVALVAPVAQLASRLDRKGGLAAALSAAAMPVRAGEYLLLVGAGGIAAAVAFTLVLRSWILGLAAAIGVAYVASIAPRVAASKRRRAVEAQLPDALATIGASLEAGHTFLRAIQMYAEEAQPPLADELTRVVAESSLGDPILDALDRMAARLHIPDLDWVVQAIRIQQETGGRLAEVLHTLADFMRAREEVRREVKTLTAEGRVSATVLGAMPPLMFLTFQAINPGYAEPLLQGWGLAVLGGAAASTAIGVGLIVRMVKIEV